MATVSPTAIDAAKEVAGGFDFPNFPGIDNFSPFLGDTLGAWLTYENIKAQKDVSGSAQEATRSAPPVTRGNPANFGTQQGGMSGGITGTHLLVGGVALAAVFLLVK